MRPEVLQALKPIFKGKQEFSLYLSVSENAVDVGGGSCLMADGYSTQLQMLIYFRAGCSLSHYTKKRKKRKKRWGLPSGFCYEIDPDHKTLELCCIFSGTHTVP